MSDLLAAYRELLIDGDLTCTVSDALGRTGGLSAAFRALTPGARLLGYAVTARTFGTDLTAVFGAIEAATPGSVVVIATGGSQNSAFWGERTTRAAQARGVTGAVIDGPARDVGALARLNFPVFGTGSVPNAGLPGGRGSVNVPVALGGQVVSPGDLIVADENGVVVVPRAEVENVLARVRELLAAEQALFARSSAPADLQPTLEGDAPS